LPDDKGQPHRDGEWDGAVDKHECWLDEEIRGPATVTATSLD
jgi:hypothetical protein